MNAPFPLPGTDKLTVALWLAEQGFRIHPVPAGSKIPTAGSEWKKDATTDPDKIRKWFTDDPGCNYLIAPDEHHFILDIDEKNGCTGVADLEALEAENGDLPTTFTVKSPTGGFHSYLIGNAPPSVKKKSLRGSIDVRGNANGKASYVIGPGSKIDDHAYEVVNSQPIAAAPKWLLELCAQAPLPKLERAKDAEIDNAGDVIRMAGYVRQLVENGDVAVSGQGGNNRTYQLFAELLDYLSPEKSLEIIEPWNAACVPPWSSAELERIRDNVIQYRQNEIGARASKPLDKVFNLPKAQGTPVIYDDGLDVERIADIPPKRIDWLWPDRFACGKLSLIAGQMDNGKTLITANIAATITNGSAWPFSQDRAERGAVLFLNAEDNIADALHPRLLAASADTKLTFRIKSVVKETDGGERIFDLAQDMERVAQRIARIEEETGVPVRLLIIDPISAYMGGKGKADTWKNSDVRYVLNYVKEFAERTGLAVIGITHFNKSEGNNVLNKIIDSTAFPGFSRSVFVVMTEPDTDGRKTGRKLFMRAKGNDAGNVESLAYKIQQVFMPAPDGGPDIRTARVVWDQCVPITADEAMAKQSGKPSRLSEAKEFLRVVLANGPVSITKIYELAEGKHSPITLKRAKVSLGVVSQRAGGVGDDGEWTWALP